MTEERGTSVGGGECGEVVGDGESVGETVETVWIEREE